MLGWRDVALAISETEGGMSEAPRPFVNAFPEAA